MFFVYEMNTKNVRFLFFFKKISVLFFSPYRGPLIWARKKKVKGLFTSAEVPDRKRYPSAGF